MVFSHLNCLAISLCMDVFYAYLLLIRKKDAIGERDQKGHFLLFRDRRV